MLQERQVTHAIIQVAVRQARVVRGSHPLPSALLNLLNILLAAHGGNLLLSNNLQGVEMLIMSLLRFDTTINNETAARHLASPSKRWRGLTTFGTLVFPRALLEAPILVGPGQGVCIYAVDAQLAASRYSYLLNAATEQHFCRGQMLAHAGMLRYILPAG